MVKRKGIKTGRNPLSTEKKEALDSTILRMLSMDARTPLGHIANEAGVSKTTVYHELNRLIKERDIHFVPEIDIDNLWKSELKYLTKGTGATELKNLSPDSVGFQQYICLVQFTKKIPTDNEIVNAVGFAYNWSKPIPPYAQPPQSLSHIVQYIGKLSRSKYHLIMFIVARNSNDISNFTLTWHSRLLEGCEARLFISQVRRTHGFFPIRNELIEQFKIPSNYKKLLKNLNQNARGELSANMGKDVATRSYQNLIKENIMKRTTLYMGRPKNSLNGAILTEVSDSNKWIRSGWTKWATKLVQQNHYKGEIVALDDVYNPLGLFILFNAKDPKEADKIKGYTANTGVEFKETLTISKDLLGHLGIRNFDMRQGRQYRVLKEVHGRAPNIDRL